MAKAEGASIYIDAQSLRKLLIRSLQMMTRQNRIEIGSRAVQESGELIAAFVMAYDFEEERWYYFRRLYAVFEVLKVDVRMIIEDGVLQSPHPVTHERPETVHLLMLETIGRIDEAITKWKTRVVRQARSRADSGSPEE